MAKRGRKSQYDLKRIFCPNPKCLLYWRTGKGNIVSNGTYRTKEGENVRRFRCKQCGQSFCSRIGKVSHGLRTSEEKILLAFQFLVDGVPLRDIAERVEVKLDTIRHWLRVAATQRDKWDTLLLKKIRVTQDKLDTLWSFVEDNSLRQRAAIWRARHQKE